MDGELYGCMSGYRLGFMLELMLAEQGRKLALLGLTGDMTHTLVSIPPNTYICYMVIYEIDWGTFPPFPGSAGS
jgi:hypothetical protein